MGDSWFIHSFATSHESDFFGLKLASLIEWWDSFPSVGLSPRVWSSHLPLLKNVQYPLSSTLACIIYTGVRHTPIITPTHHSVGANLSAYPALIIFSMSSGVPRHGVLHCDWHFAHWHDTGFLPDFLLCDSLFLGYFFYDWLDIFVSSGKVFQNGLECRLFAIDIELYG